MTTGRELSQARARGRIALLMTAIMPKLDQLLIECAQARIPAPGILEMIDWAQYALDEVAIASLPDLDIRPDPIKDAQAAATVAARRGNSADYAAAKAAEALARAAA